MFKMVEKILLLGVLAVVLLASLLCDAAAKTKFSVSKLASSQQVGDQEYSVVYRKNGKRNWWEENQTYSTRFRIEQLVAPVALVGIGALGVGENSPMRGINLAIKDGLYEASKGVKLRFDDYVQYVPVAFYLTLDFMGLEAKHSFGERVAVAAVTYIAVTALSQSIKHIVREPRPDTGSRNSFPSGHTTTAFASAVALWLENRKIGLPAIVFSVIVAVSRLYFQVHYLTDVLAGAVSGILFALLAYYLVDLACKRWKFPFC